jgi:site-specific recombinase XerC
MKPNPLSICSLPVTNNELPGSPLGSIAQAYLDALRAQQYSEHTVDRYLGVLDHLDHWMGANGLRLQDIDATLCSRFVRSHLPACSCSLKLHASVGESRAAIRHLLKLFPDSLAKRSSLADPIAAAELEQFADYLRNVRGVRPGTVAYFCRDVGALLSHCFKDMPIEPRHLQTVQIDRFSGRQVFVCGHLLCRFFAPAYAATSDTVL